MMEAYALTPKRNEYGKAIRKLYERGLLYEQRKNMVRLEPRTPLGVCGTITTVEKDNYILIEYENN